LEDAISRSLKSIKSKVIGTSAQGEPARKTSRTEGGTENADRVHVTNGASLQIRTVSLTLFRLPKLYVIFDTVRAKN